MYLLIFGSSKKSVYHLHFGLLTKISIIYMFLPRITQVELNSKSYIRERGVGQSLFALKEEQGKSFHVNARVIPLCPMTAKVVPRNLHSKVVSIMQLFEVFCWFPKGGSQGIGES